MALSLEEWQNQMREQNEPQEDVVLDEGMPGDTPPAAPPPAATPPQPDPGLAAVMQIPGVQDLIRAARSGQKMVVLPEDELRKIAQPQQQAAPEPEPEPDWENLSGSALATALQRKIVGQAVSSFNATLREQLAPLMERIESLNQDTQSFKAEKLRNEVVEVMKDHPDIVRYRDTMLQLKAENPNLSVKELYTLAKLRSGHVDPPVAPVERPVQAAPRAPKESPKEPIQPGARRNQLEQALRRAFLEAAKDINEG